MNPLHLLVRSERAIASRWRNLWFRALGVKITGYAWLQRISIPRQWSDIALGRIALDDGVVLLSSGAPGPTRISIGHGTYINRFTMLDASEQISISENCMIGPHCYITDHDHGHAKGEKIGRQALVGSPVTIEQDVWIGAGVIILKGVAVGKGAIIAAGAVVTKPVAPWTIAGGVPARQIGVRE